MLFELNGADWMPLARCRTEPAELFFPSDGKGVVRARQVCALCPVQSECLDYALRNHMEHGVWGGKSERERRALQRQRRLGFLVLPSERVH